MNRIGCWMFLAALAAPVTLVGQASADPPPATTAPAPRLAAPTLPAHPAYLQIPDLTGAVTDVAHKGWFEISSFQWGVGRSSSSATGGGGTGKESHTPSVSEIVITKTTDAASPNLFRAAVTGKHFPQVVLEVLTRDGSKRYQFVMSDVVIAAKSSAGGDRPTESLSLNFTKIEFRTTSTSAPTASPVTVTYDLANRESF